MIVGHWAIFGLYFPLPGMWACYWFCLLPRAVGFCLVVLLVVPVCGCWVLGVCLVVCVGCARMWVIDCRLSGVFLFRADAPFPLF